MDLVVAAIFGLIISFGVWCNVVLPTGDNVEITARIQRIDPEELCVLTRRLTLVPLVFSSVMPLPLLLVSSWMAQFPGWLKWGALPFGLCLVGSFISYRHCRKWIHDEN